MRLRVPCLGLAFLSLLAMSACGATATGGDGSVTDVALSDAASDLPVPADTAVRVPLNHRPDASPCATPPPAVNCTLGGGPIAACSMDSQCTNGTNGRCALSTGAGAESCQCTYDTCTTDGQCTAGGPCACHGSAYVGQSGNACTGGNCQVDANCGPSGFCSPTQGGCGGVSGYYCHTASDRCVDDADCASAGSQAVCVYDNVAAHWDCQTLLRCG